MQTTLCRPCDYRRAFRFRYLKLPWVDYSYILYAYRSAKVMTDYYRVMSDKLIAELLEEFK